MKALKIANVLVCLLIVVGCGKDSEDQTTPSLSDRELVHGVLPLGAGNRLLYGDFNLKDRGGLQCHLKDSNGRAFAEKVFAFYEKDDRTQFRVSVPFSEGVANLSSYTLDVTPESYFRVGFEHVYPDNDFDDCVSERKKKITTEYQPLPNGIDVKGNMEVSRRVNYDQRTDSCKQGKWQPAEKSTFEGKCFYEADAYQRLENEFESAPGLIEMEELPEVSFNKGDQPPLKCVSVSNLDRKSAFADRIGRIIKSQLGGPRQFYIPIGSIAMEAGKDLVEKLANVKADLTQLSSKLENTGSDWSKTYEFSVRKTLEQNFTYRASRLHKWQEARTCKTKDSLTGEVKEYPCPISHTSTEVVYGLCFK